MASSSVWNEPHESPNSIPGVRTSGTHEEKSPNCNIKRWLSCQRGFCLHVSLLKCVTFPLSDVTQSPLHGSVNTVTCVGALLSSNLNIQIFFSFFAVSIFHFDCVCFDGAPKSLHQEEIKANICGIMDREMNSLTSKLVVWVPLNVTSMHVPDRWSGTRLMGMFNTWAWCQFRQACPRNEAQPAY